MSVKGPVANFWDQRIKEFKDPSIVDSEGKHILPEEYDDGEEEEN